MPTLPPDRMTEPVCHSVHARMSDILDRAASQSGVSPEDFRAAIREAMQYAHPSPNEHCSSDVSPEAFVLSLLGALF